MPSLLSTDGRRIAEISVLRASQNQRQRNPDFASSGWEAIGAILSFLDGKHSVTGGDPTRVVFSGPLYGGSPDEWVTGLTELRDRFQGGKGPALPTGRQAQGFSKVRTGPSACHFSTLD